MKKNKKSKQPKRWFRFVYDDGTIKEVVITQYTVLNKTINRIIMHLDRFVDGTNLLIMNEDFLPDDKKLERREDEKISTRSK